MNKMISVASDFQYSVNIGYDLNNDEKLKNFIPTKSALALLEEILLSTEESSSERARVLIGAYGKGKSHIVLMILSLLLKKDLSLFRKMMPKVEQNPRLFQLVQNYYDSDKKILPVIITGSNTSLTQAFLLALQRTLSENDLLSVMPATNYQAVTNVIRRWKDHFPDTYNQFSKSIDEPVESFVERIENYDIVAYEMFEGVYPQLTAGSTFNPFLGFDVVELYESVTAGLKNKGYSGIYVVYDEFSKYLEANIVDASISDTKMLQDFAEKCNRSAANQMHLMLISHKEIANYIDKLPRQKVDGWRGVSERFKHIHMNNNFSQTYEIISTVIQKSSKWTQFCKNHQKEFNGLKRRYQQHQMFFDAKSEIDVVLFGCYPLHPVSTFILPRLSERIAQNERTLFTFLSAEGNSTLQSYLSNHDEKEYGLISPDQIYDYFEPLFKKEAYEGSIHSTYQLTASILSQLPEESLGCKIVKTISLIYILEQYERLKPTKEEIIGIYSSQYDVKQIEDEIQRLIEKEFVVYIKQSNGYLRLKRTSGVDIQKKINDLIEKESGKVSTKETLNNANFDNYMYPSRYNDEFEMVRYFMFKFIESDEISSDINWDIKSENDESDGIIYAIIPSMDTDLDSVIECIKRTSTNSFRHIFVLPKKKKSIEDIIREYHAVTLLRDTSTADPVLFDEYEVIYEDLQEVIRSYISEFTRPENNAAIYIHNGKVMEINRKAALTELMSSICDEIYYETPVVNNEYVNRNVITGVAANSRNKIIGALLRGILEPNLGLSGTGQEISIMRSTLIRTGIWNEDNKVDYINMHPSDRRVESMLGTIEQFILEARKNGEMSFSKLYEKLMSPDYHIGLRKGLIPIYLAVVMHKYLQQIIIVDKNGQVPTNIDTLIQINANPGMFKLQYLDWDNEKEAYISRLAEAFDNYIIEAERTGNYYDFVSNAIHRWYMSLPKYAKESKVKPTGEKIVKRQLEMMRAIRQGSSSSDLLFKDIPTAFAYKEDFTADVAEDVITTKAVFDNLLRELKEYLIYELKKLFVKNSKSNMIKRMSLSSVLKEWLESLDSTITEQLFEDGTNRFINLIGDITNDEELFITNAAKVVTDLRIEDWDGKTQKTFLSTIQQYKDTAETFHSNVVVNTINETSCYQVSFMDEEGNNTIKRFDQVDITGRGKLLFNQITAALDAMGHSITEQEKRQVLMEILKKMCD